VGLMLAWGTGRGQQRYERRRFLATAPAFATASLAIRAGAAGAAGATSAAAARSPAPLLESLTVVVPEQVRQGRTLMVEVKLEDGSPLMAVRGRFGSAGSEEGAAATDGNAGALLRFFPAGQATGSEGGTYSIALAGVPVDAPLGRWAATVVARDGQGAEEMGTAELEIVDGGFAVQRVVFGADLLPLLEPGVGLQEVLTLAAVMAAGAERDSGPRWQGRFRLPVVGRVVTPHGARRDYLDPAGQVVARSQHNGVDLAVAGGTPIAAPAAGVVAFAGRWAIRGNVVVLDHGAGVHSVHAHASELLVAAGQEVVAGQVLARVGTTGLSTGPHLHWEVRVGGLAVEPLEWTQRDDLGLA
jgi:murein DD-endopeptidase MepM/ murein hydrolase activator NlpD